MTEEKYYYRQLKRLEQENKELKKQIESQKGLITVGGKQQYKYLQRIDELEQENKELKNKNICRETCEYFKRICNENTLLIKYRSTLEEINRALLGIHGLSIHCNKQIIKVKAIINEVLNDN
jgi:hypothetical protein